jgi:hypothetical protein
MCTANQPSVYAMRFNRRSTISSQPEQWHRCQSVQARATSRLPNDGMHKSSTVPIPQDRRKSVPGLDTHSVENRDLTRMYDFATW